MKVNVFSEYGRLRTVVMARVDNFYEHIAINNTQSVFYGTEDTPKLEVMVRQQQFFASELERHGVKILWAKSISDAPEQTHARDVAFAIGKHLFISPMKEEVRQHEAEGLTDILAQVETPVHKNLCGVIEGGDVLVDTDKVFVGYSDRTDEEGLIALERIISSEGFRIVPIQMKEGYLHLDTVFNIFAPKSALIYPDAIENDSLKILEREYNLLTVSKEEQFSLGTNTFSINPSTLVCDPRNIGVMTKLKKTGIFVVEVPYSEIAKTGGLFRCGTCPLVRD